uniref:Uncharacterized protein n=1 Tax=Maylandia zebra TaxID=106582 RepID=A0A3P9CMG5_9CICH
VHPKDQDSQDLHIGETKPPLMNTPAFTNSIGHSSTRRVNHGHEASKAQVLSGEVHIISVKSKAFFELVIRQVIVAETYKAQIKCD